MSNSGERLERIVREIEEHLLPLGLKVTCRKRIYNDNGVQLAEFDLEIEGLVGSTIFRWLIECRDRPASDSEPGSWIEQLGGRRQVYRFDKVTAVSTSGFSPGAVEAARQLNVELRTISPVARDAVTDWFRMEAFSVRILKSEVHDAMVFYSSEAPDEAKDWAESEIRACTLTDKCLFSSETGKAHSILEAWQGFMNQKPDLSLQLKDETGSKRIEKRVNYINPHDRFEFLTPHGPVPINAIRFLVDVTIERSNLPIRHFSEYRQILGDQTIAQTVAIPFQVGDQVFECRFHNFGTADKTLVRFGAMDPSNESGPDSSA